MPIPEIGQKGNIGLKSVFYQAIPDILLMRGLEGRFYNLAASGNKEEVSE
jgi:hypothetical protein